MFRIFRKKDKKSGELQDVQLRPVEQSGIDPLDKLLGDSRNTIGKRLKTLVGAYNEIDEDLLEELETTLLTADVGVKASLGIMDNLRAAVTNGVIRDPQSLLPAVQAELYELIEPCEQFLAIDTTHKPFVILMVGINGAGKTTTIGKLAQRFKEEGLSVMLAAGDTFRAAAVEQLKSWGARNDVPVVAQGTGADSAAVIFDAIESAKAREIDVLIADTAGRLHTQSNLMEELKKIHRVIGRVDPSAPHEVMLVVDAGTGTNALNQAQHFNDAVNITGITITKLDGTARGGMLFAIASDLGVPIRYIGVGEAAKDLRPFDAGTFINAIPAIGLVALPLTSFAEGLLEWWDNHGRKDLPWQHPRTAYRVWVSEIMLQQTQVKTVIPYFNRFIDRFPDVQTLAVASDDEVLAYWSGLGYYARARNLLKTAKICQEDNAGELPESPEALEDLPGIGQSTANAIFSQAFNEPAVVLDGNVKRVLCRYFAVDGWPGKSVIHKQLWGLAGKLLPSDRGADYTQAIMDLGATLCTRTAPRCDQCPVNVDCQALKTGTVAKYPGKRPAMKIARTSFHMLILTDKNRNVLLQRRPPTGIWGGLWSLPTDDESGTLQQRLGLDYNKLRTLPALQHQLTHMHMTIRPLIGNTDIAARSVECATDLHWFGQDQWPALGLPKPVRQLLETHLENFGK